MDEAVTIRVIHDPEKIKLLGDLVRRQLLRLISDAPMTQKQLSERMNLTEPSVSHHLTRLTDAGLVRINHTEVGSYGILQKYYEPTAKLFIEDWDSTPAELRRYFIHAHMERLRGMLSVFQMMVGENGNLLFDAAELESLAEVTAQRISKIAETYTVGETEDRENLLVQIYATTLRNELMSGGLDRVEKSGRLKEIVNRVGIIG